MFKVKTLSTLTLVAKNLYFLQTQYSVAKSETALAVPKAIVGLCVCVGPVLHVRTPWLSVQPQLTGSSFLEQSWLMWVPAADSRTSRKAQLKLRMLITIVPKQVFHKYITRKKTALAFVFFSCYSLLYFYSLGCRILNCRRLGSSPILSSAASVTLDWVSAKIMCFFPIRGKSAQGRLTGVLVLTRTFLKQNSDREFNETRLWRTNKASFKEVKEWQQVL